ncbi:ABC transporter ATP-binding protein [Pseudonocardia xishanensis]|uniref:ABC transporter ATP-binding protein n=1 Tax=Pseudonocardia xishanensis TaxID=630995 RepID=UPI0031E66DDE
MTETAVRTETAIGVRDLRVRYGGFEAVRGVDLEVRRGEVFALLGTNGAGKTTTLEVLEGFRARSAGEVSVLGLDPGRERHLLRERMGIQLQEGGFVDELTVGETLELWGRLSPREDRVARLLDRFDLVPRRDVRVSALSGGEKRRLDLATAVWGSPELVVLDEPTTGLDPAARRRTWDAIQELQDGGRTVVLTTHYLEEAEALADRVAIMHEGRVAVAGSLAEILASRPSSFSATLPAGVAPPRGLDGPEVLVHTDDLQRDLTAFLGWAADRGVTLTDLRAAPASLADIYLSIRSEEK